VQSTPPQSTPPSSELRRPSVHVCSGMGTRSPASESPAPHPQKPAPLGSSRMESKAAFISAPYSVYPLWIRAPAVSIWAYFTVKFAALPPLGRAWGSAATSLMDRKAACGERPKFTAIAAVSRHVIIFP
jgi:hypothetical protein